MFDNVMFLMFDFHYEKCYIKKIYGLIVWVDNAYNIRIVYRVLVEKITIVTPQIQ